MDIDIEQILQSEEIISEGSDSYVYKYNGRVLKIYEPLQDRVPIENAYSMISKYVEDTRRVSDIINRKHRRKPIVLAGKELLIEPEILSQGEPLISESGRVYTFGQRYISGLNMSDIKASKQRTLMDNSGFETRIYYQELQELNRYGGALFRLINKELNRRFWFFDNNAKAYTNFKEGIVYFIVTDLSMGLIIDYKEVVT
jgi:hypothetical protein